MTSVLRDLKNKITGADKYHANLLGESLPDLLRKATAKTLVTPDEAINQQVAETIQQEAAGGRDTKDIVTSLKKRLRSDNPQKQFLAVHLVDRVMAECSVVLGLHQEELLQEVAKVMAKPSKPETDAGKAARTAARELLRKCGRAGNTAFRAAQQDMYGRSTPVGAGYAAAAGAASYGYTGADYGAPGAYGDGMNVERQSLAEEINMLIDQAKTNTELLSDMLVNSTGVTAPQDDFEQELISDLLQKITELRGILTAYLEQLQTVEGADMEVLMVQALEAVDLLDGCIALHKDVGGNQQLPSQGGAPTGGNSYHGQVLNYSLAQPAVAAPAAAPAGAAPAPARAVQPPADLIALDDPFDFPSSNTAGPAPPAASNAGHDPFAASNAAPLFGAPAPAAAPVQAGSVAGGPAKMTSAFESMFAQPAGGNAAFGATLAAAAAPSGAPQPTAAAAVSKPMPQQLGTAPQPAQAAGFGAGPYGGGAYAAAPPHGGYGTAASNPFGGAPSPYGVPQSNMYSTAPFAYGPAGVYNAPAPQQPRQQSYGAPSPMGYGVPSAGAFGAPAPAAFGGVASAGTNPFGSAAPASNPFGPSQSQQQPEPRDSADGSTYGMPMPPAGLMGPARPAQAAPPVAGAASSNPFAASAPGTASGAQPSLNQEWDMFFANRAGGAAGAMNTQQVHADFESLVKPTTAAR